MLCQEICLIMVMPVISFLMLCFIWFISSFILFFHLVFTKIGCDYKVILGQGSGESPEDSLIWTIWVHPYSSITESDPRVKPDFQSSDSGVPWATGLLYACPSQQACVVDSRSNSRMKHSYAMLDFHPCDSERIPCVSSFFSLYKKQS